MRLDFSISRPAKAAIGGQPGAGGVSNRGGQGIEDPQPLSPLWAGQHPVIAQEGRARRQGRGGLNGYYGLYFLGTSVMGGGANQYCYNLTDKAKSWQKVKSPITHSRRLEPQKCL